MNAHWFCRLDRRQDTRFWLWRARSLFWFCHFAFRGLPQAMQLRFNRAEATGKFVQAVFCTDSADDQPDGQSQRGSQNYQDEQNNGRFHRFYLSTVGTTWVVAMCPGGPSLASRKCARTSRFAFMGNQDNATANRALN